MWFRFRHPLVHFDVNGEQDTGGQANGATTPTPGGTQGGQSQTTPQTSAPQTSERTFTQEEVNQLIAGRARDLVKSRLKVDSLEEAERVIKTAKDLEDSQKTEHQKALDQAIKETRKQVEEEFEAKLEQVQKEANLTLIKAEARSQATVKGFIDPEDAWLRMTDWINDGRVKVNDKGEVVGVDKFLEKLAADKPYLTRQPGTGGSPRLGGPSGNGTGPSADERRRIAEENARQMVFGGPMRRVM